VRPHDQAQVVQQHAGLRAVVLVRLIANASNAARFSGRYECLS
jgi:hypothetical protein